MRTIFESILLTIIALMGLGAVVYFIMYFATTKDLDLAPLLDQEEFKKLVFEA